MVIAPFLARHTSPSTAPWVLVTDANRHVGSATAHRLLDGGLVCEALCALPKTLRIRKGFSTYSDRFQAIEVAHIAAPYTFASAIKGKVDAPFL